MDSHLVKNVAELEMIYGSPAQTALDKVADRLTPLYRQWIMASRFCVVSTVGPDGTDGSPRGDDGPVVTELDPKTLLLPDWRGNNRMDTLRNIVADGRISLMFMVAGSTNVVRVNGTAVVSLDPDLIARFDKDGHVPRSIVVITIAEVYVQCARAIMRAGLWPQDKENLGLPRSGQFVAEQRADFDADSYESAWTARAAATMWSDPK